MLKIRILTFIGLTPGLFFEQKSYFRGAFSCFLGRKLSRKLSFLRSYAHHNPGKNCVWIQCFIIEAAVHVSQTTTKLF